MSDFADIYEAPEEIQAHHERYLETVKCSCGGEIKEEEDYTEDGVLNFKCFCVNCGKVFLEF